MDKLIVKGLPPLDGEYEFDIISMLTTGHADSLTNREGHRVKLMAGVRAGELQEAFQAGDSDVLVALAAIILTRHGKRFDEERLWDAPMGSGLEFEIEERKEEEADDGPPVQGPPLSEPTSSPTTSGGESLSPTSAPPVNGLSPTGRPRSVTPMSVPDSDLEISAI